MIEPEIAFADLSDNATLAERLLKHAFATLLDRSAEDLAFFDERIEKGMVAKLEGIVGSEFVRMDYGEAIQILERAKGAKFEFPVHWGVDLQSEHERYLTEKHARKPVVVMNYPKDIKAFYMRVNDDGRTVAAMDVLAPGIGEIIGGSQREERLDVLDAQDGRTRHRHGALRLVPRSAPLRHRAACRVRSRLRAHARLCHRPVECARCDPVPEDAGQRAVLRRSVPIPANSLPAGNFSFPVRRRPDLTCRTIPCTEFPATGTGKKETASRDQGSPNREAYRVVGFVCSFRPLHAPGGEWHMIAAIFAAAFGPRGRRRGAAPVQTLERAAATGAFTRLPC